MANTQPYLSKMCQRAMEKVNENYFNWYISLVSLFNGMGYLIPKAYL